MERSGGVGPMLNLTLTPIARGALATILITATVIFGVWGLEALIDPPWLGSALPGILLTGVAIVVTRVLIGRSRARRVGPATRSDTVVTRSPWPTIAGALVGSLDLLSRFGNAGVDAPPTPGRLVALLGEAGDLVRGSVAPLAPADSIVFLVTVSAIALLLLADLAAVTLGRPLLAAPALLALWWPTLLLRSEVRWLIFVVTVISLLSLLALRSGSRFRDGTSNGHRSGRSPGVVAALMASITAVALVTSAASTDPEATRGWTRWFRTGAGVLGQEIDPYRSLGHRSDQVQFTFATRTGHNVGKWRLHTMWEFDGRLWLVDNRPRALEEFGPGTLLFLGDARPSANRESVDITIEALRENSLPLPVEPRLVVVDDRWQHDAARDTVVGPGTRNLDEFSLVVHPRELTSAALRNAPPPPTHILTRYAYLSVSRHNSDLVAYATALAGMADTHFDKAVLIQTHLRAGSFIYSETAPPVVTGDPVWDFLQHQEGFCVQFATAFVVLARAVNVPARLAVGYQPGTQLPDGTWQVTGQHAHAWPEVYFRGFGWVPFEPTPSTHAGPPPAYADPLGERDALPEFVGPIDYYDPVLDMPDHLTPTVPNDIESDDSAAAGDYAIDTPGGSLNWLWGAIAGLSALAAVAWWWLRRRARWMPRTAEEAWARSSRALRKAGIFLPLNSTPRRIPNDVAESWRTTKGQGLPAQLLPPLQVIATELELERYARNAPSDTARCTQLRLATKQIELAIRD